MITTESTPRTGGAKRRIFVVEDHPLMRRSLVAALARESDLIVCGQAEDAPEALSAIKKLQPDLVLTDIELKSSSGIDLIKALHAAAGGPLIVATTMFNAAENERRARTAGASDFVSKQGGPDALIATVRDVLRSAPGCPPKSTPPPPVFQP